MSLRNHEPNQIRHFNIGAVVEDKPDFENYIKVGHVVGFDHNGAGEVVVVVKFAGEDNTRLRHPSNLTKL